MDDWPDQKVGVAGESNEAAGDAITHILFSCWTKKSVLAKRK